MASMTTIRILLLSIFAASALAQAPQPQTVYVIPPTAEEVAFSRLPADIRSRLSYLPPAQAMQIVAQTGQHAIALGTPQPSAEQFRSTLGAVLNAPYSTYTSASAGASSFPPLSPLVPPPPPPFLR
jgi:hypothetical protein